jgi:hypothetical protein
MFEQYKWKYHHWFFVEWADELLDFGLVVIGERYNREIYWAIAVMRILYILGHAILRPSLYAFHNVLSVVSGCAQLAEDAAVLEDIYGNGVLTGGLWYSRMPVCPAFDISWTMDHVAGRLVQVWALLELRTGPRSYTP